MRFEGHIKSWDDARGFGFIEPALGGQEIFVHIKAFPARAGRPQVGQPLSFRIELNAQGKKRATDVQPIRPAPPPRPPRRNSPAQWGTASLLAIPAFVLVYFAASVLWRPPAWTAAVYLVASVVCFGAYAVDKAAARSGRRRVAEKSLLMLGVLGGWPGALMAQQVLRHKSNKASFQVAFWVSVVANVSVFLVVSSPILRR